MQHDEKTISNCHDTHGGRGQRTTVANRFKRRATPSNTERKSPQKRAASPCRSRMLTASLAVTLLGTAIHQAKGISKSATTGPLLQLLLAAMPPLPKPSQPRPQSLPAKPRLAHAQTHVSSTSYPFTTAQTTLTTQNIPLLLHTGWLAYESRSCRKQRTRSGPLGRPGRVCSRASVQKPTGTSLCSTSPFHSWARSVISMCCRALLSRALNDASSARLASSPADDASFFIWPCTRA